MRYPSWTSKSRVKRSAVIILFLLPLLSFCDREAAGDERSINLAGKWSIVTEDSPEAASPRFDDGGSRRIDIPGDWAEVLREREDLLATVWIRKKVFIGREWEGKPLVLSLGRIGIADEAYVNGTRIGLSGIIPPDGSALYYHNSWQVPRSYYIPESALIYGEENLIALRVFSHVISGVSGEVTIGDHGSGYFRGFYNSYRSLIISIASLVINALLFAVFLLLFLSETRKTEYLYFSLLILFTMICIVITVESPLAMNGLTRYKLFLFFYVLTNFFAFHGVRKFLGHRLPGDAVVPGALLAFVEGLVLFSPTTRWLIHYGGFASLVFVNLCILASAAMFFVSIRQDPRRYWYFLLISIPVPFSVIRNSYYLFTFRFNDLPLTIFLHVPMVFILVMMYYIYDFERSRKEKDSLYAALMKKSKTIQRRLLSARQSNRKPEPRDIINRVVEYLDANFAERYDRIELSKKFGLNEDYMGQIFKKATGTNISNYININRINAAKSLLVDTSAKIIDVAYHVGFDNLTHFHRQFKKQTGCTPNEYRTLVLKENE